MRSAPPGHRDPERPHDDNPYIKLDGPTRRLFSDSELEPLAAMLRHSLANEVVNRYINEALRALPTTGSARRACTCQSWGLRFDTWRSGRQARSSSRRPTAAGRVTGCSSSSAPRGPSTGFFPAHDFSPTRIRLVFAPNHPTLRPQVLGIPGARRIWLIKADELYAHLLTPRRRGAVSGRSEPATQGAGGEAAGEQLRAAAVAGHRRHGQSGRRAAGVRRLRRP